MPSFFTTTRVNIRDKKLDGVIGGTYQDARRCHAAVDRKTAIARLGISHAASRALPAGGAATFGAIDGHAGGGRSFD